MALDIDDTHPHIFCTQNCFSNRSSWLYGVLYFQLKNRVQVKIDVNSFASVLFSRFMPFLIKGKKDIEKKRLLVFSFHDLIYSFIVFFPSN